MAQATWIDVDLPGDLEVLGPFRCELFPGAGDYETIKYPLALRGERFHGRVCKLSTNGVLIKAAVVPPLLSRMVLHLSLPSFGMLSAIGMLLGRRERGDESFFLLFEAISLRARQAIDEQIERSSRAKAAG